MSNGDIRALGFEVFQRDNPNIKKIGSYWRSDPEFETWMNVYLDPENKTVQYFEEEDHKIGTFYRALDEAELRKREEEVAAVETEKAETPRNPQYEILSIVHQHAPDDAHEHKVWHVKLGIPRWVPVGDRFGLAEYVLVEQERRRIEDDNGAFLDIFTRVDVSDENQERYDDARPLYIAPSFLGVEECMFAIGEWPTLAVTDGGN